MRKYLLLLVIRFENLIDYVIDFLFDFSLKVDTRKRVSLTDLSINNINILNAKKYQGTRSRIFKKIINNLDINPSNYNFIDLGSGKGKVLLMASAYNYKNLIGVEFSEQLHKIAVDNLNKQNLLPRAKLYHKDIMNFTPPKGPNIFYLYNPVNNILLKDYFQNLIDQKLLHEEDIIIYLNPRYHRELDRLNLKREVLITDFNFNKIALTYRM